MAGFGRSEFVDLIKPPGERIHFYDPTKPPTDQPKNDAADPTRGVPHAFIDAMTVREEVFIQEHNLEREKHLDSDDARSFHWVAYASIPTKATTNGSSNGGDRRTSTSTSTKIPIGTVRLTPPPHASIPEHEATQQQVNSNGEKEAYIQIGRLAVIKEFRKAGISKLLIETALSYARENPYEVGPHLDPASMEAMKKGMALNFKGLVYIHTPAAVQKVWKRYGFERDEGMGTWQEDGIDVVGMWKRLEISDSRRKSKIWLATNPTSP